MIWSRILIFSHAETETLVLEVSYFRSSTIANFHFCTLVKKLSYMTIFQFLKANGMVLNFGLVGWVYRKLDRQNKSLIFMDVKS